MEQMKMSPEIEKSRSVEMHIRQKFVEQAFQHENAGIVEIRLTPLFTSLPSQLTQKKPSAPQQTRARNEMTR